MAAKIDETAHFLNSAEWGNIEFPAPFGRAEYPEEVNFMICLLLVYCYHYGYFVSFHFFGVFVLHAMALIQLSSKIQFSPSAPTVATTTMLLLLFSLLYYYIIISVFLILTSITITLDRHTSRNWTRVLDRR